jgi:hypothetical protein
MFGPGCHVSCFGYNLCTGVDLYIGVFLLVAVIVVTDFAFALVDLGGGREPDGRSREPDGRSHEPNGRLRRTLAHIQSLEEYFWAWTHNHPVSALVLAFLVGAAVSHFFWAVAPPR